MPSKRLLHEESTRLATPSLEKSAGPHWRSSFRRSLPFKVERVGKILSLQLFRVRDVVNSGDWTQLPKIDGGFDLLTLYNETTDGV